MISVTFTLYSFGSGEMNDLLLLQRLVEKADKTTVYPSKGLGMAVKEIPWGANGKIMKRKKGGLKIIKFMTKELVAIKKSVIDVN